MSAGYELGKAVGHAQAQMEYLKKEDELRKQIRDLKRQLKERA